MVVTRWKDSRVLQTISTMMVKGTTTVQWQTGWEVQSAECPNDTQNYQDDIYAVGKGDQHRALAYELAALQHGGVVQRKRLIKSELHSVPCE
eukprot:12813470-Ditylum_brightwellii.AAC.1